MVRKKFAVFGHNSIGEPDVWFTIVEATEQYFSEDTDHKYYEFIRELATDKGLDPWFGLDVVGEDDSRWKGLELDSKMAWKTAAIHEITEAAVSAILNPEPCGPCGGTGTMYADDTNFRCPVCDGQGTL